MWKKAFDRLQQKMMLKPRGKPAVEAIILTLTCGGIGHGLRPALGKTRRPNLKNN
jgi:hypothetical protein